MANESKQVTPRNLFNKVVMKTEDGLQTYLTQAGGWSEDITEAKHFQSEGMTRDTVRRYVRQGLTVDAYIDREMETDFAVTLEILFTCEEAQLSIQKRDAETRALRSAYGIV